MNRDVVFGKWQFSHVLFWLPLWHAAQDSSFSASDPVAPPVASSFSQSKPRLPWNPCIVGVHTRGWEWNVTMVVLLWQLAQKV